METTCGMKLFLALFEELIKNARTRQFLFPMNHIFVIKVSFQMSTYAQGNGEEAGGEAECWPR